MRRLVAGSTVLGFLLLVPAAHAVDPTFNVTVSPQAASFPETRNLTYRVQITTGAQEERFSLAASAVPSFIDFDGKSEGTLVSPGSAQFDGPGTIGFQALPALAVCNTRLKARHGSAPYTVDYHVTVPASTTTTLVIGSSLTADAPWPGEQYRLALTAKNAFAGMGGGAPTLDVGEIAIPVPDVPAAGRTGARLSIATNVASVPGCSGPVPPNAGNPIDVTGRADPALAGEQVRIVAARWQDQPFTLATVPVAADGTFAFRDWRPRVLGQYELAAQYTSTRPERADDFAAVRLFELTASVPAAQTTAQPAPLARAGATATARRGVARIRLRCPAGTRPCQGVLRLTSRGRLAGRKSFLVAAGRLARVPVSLRPAARRALRKSKRLRVRAEIRAGAQRSRTTIVIRGS